MGNSGTSLLRRLACAALCTVLLVGLAVEAAQSRTLKDVKPHKGVRAAHAMPIQGIDVSYYQGDIDWQTVRKAGIRFAFIKATEGGDHLDPKFRENWEGARRAGIARGAYHFVYWCRPAHEQALWFLLNVPDDTDALPPVLDLEWNSHSKTCPKNVSRAVALEKIKIMLDAMQAHTGKRPIIYTDPKFHKDVLQGAFNEYHFWLRSVAAEPRLRYGNRRWAFWQFTMTGHVPGVKGKVDRNVFNGTEADWNRVLRWLEAGR